MTKAFGVLLAVLSLFDVSAAQMSAHHRHLSLDGSTEYELLQDDGVLDAYALGRIVYVFRNSSLPPRESAVTDLAKIISVDRAVEHGTPDTLMLKQLESRLMGIELYPDLDEATVVNLGDQGFYWRISWVLFPAKGGLGGVPWTCRTYVGPDGSLIPVELALYDSISFPKADSEDEDQLISSLPIADLPQRTKAKEVVHGEEVLSRAQTELKAALKTADPVPSLQFRDQSLIQIPIKILPTGEVEYRDVWEVNFVPSHLELEAILNATPFTIWVSIEGRVGKLTWNGWKLKP